MRWVAGLHGRASASPPGGLPSSGGARVRAGRRCACDRKRGGGRCSCVRGCNTDATGAGRSAGIACIRMGTRPMREDLFLFFRLFSLQPWKNENSRRQGGGVPRGGGGRGEAHAYVFIPPQPDTRAHRGRKMKKRIRHHRQQRSHPERCERFCFIYREERRAVKKWRVTGS